MSEEIANEKLLHAMMKACIRAGRLDLVQEAVRTARCDTGEKDGAGMFAAAARAAISCAKRRNG